MSASVLIGKQARQALLKEEDAEEKYGQNRKSSRGKGPPHLLPVHTAGVGASPPLLPSRVPGAQHLSGPSQHTSSRADLNPESSAAEKGPCKNNCRMRLLYSHVHRIHDTKNKGAGQEAEEERAFPSGVYK